jgi:hypothetical protein
MRVTIAHGQTLEMGPARSAAADEGTIIAKLGDQVLIDERFRNFVWFWRVPVILSQRPTALWILWTLWEDLGFESDARKFGSEVVLLLGVLQERSSKDLRYSWMSCRHTF